MSVDPRRGPAYQYGSVDEGTGSGQPFRPDPSRPRPEDIPALIDSATRFPGDTGFQRDPNVPQNPDGSEIGPLYLSPAAEAWIEENVTRHGWYIDWGNREIFDADTGEVKGTVPTELPRML